MRETRTSGSVEGVMSNHDPYSDPDQRSSGLDPVNFLPQQLVAHAQIGDQRFQPLGFFVLDMGFPRFQVRFPAHQ